MHKVLKNDMCDGAEYMLKRSVTFYAKKIASQWMTCRLVDNAVESVGWSELIAIGRHHVCVLGLDFEVRGDLCETGLRGEIRRERS